MKVVNDLYNYGLKIVQDSDAFKFSLDSILLAEFVDNVDNFSKILDVCTGNAVIPLILSTKYENEIIAFEIQEEIYQLAEESVSLNHLENRIKVIHDDIVNVHNYFPGNKFDVVLANPPYFKYQEMSIINSNTCKAIARHEITLTLQSLFEIVDKCLKSKGYFYLVHLPERLQEIFIEAEKYQFRAKKIQFVYTNEKKIATMVLIKFLKMGNNDVKILPPLYANRYDSYKNIFNR